MFTKICPCLAWLFSTTPSRKKFKYEQRAQLQQQQFMHKLEIQAHQAKDQWDTRKTPNHVDRKTNQINIQDQLDHQLRFGSNQGNSPVLHYQNKVEEDTSVGMDISHSLGLTQMKGAEGEENNQPISQESLPSPSPDFTNMGQLPINISQNSPYYTLLLQNSKLLILTSLLSIQNDTIQIQLPLKTKINKTKLRIYRKTSPNCYIIEYQLPCSYSFYAQMMNKKIVQQVNDQKGLFKESKIIQSFAQNLEYRSLKINGGIVGGLTGALPMEYKYLKYTNTSVNDQCGHWQLCINYGSENEQNGTVMSVSYIIEDKSGEQVNIKVRTYGCIGNVSVHANEKVLEKLLVEVKKYVEIIWEQATSNYEEELV